MVYPFLHIFSITTGQRAFQMAKSMNGQASALSRKPFISYRSQKLAIFSSLLETEVLHIQVSLWETSTSAATVRTKCCSTLECYYYFLFFFLIPMTPSEALRGRAAMLQKSEYLCVPGCSVSSRAVTIPVDIYISIFLIQPAVMLHLPLPCNVPIWNLLSDGLSWNRALWAGELSCCLPAPG